MPPDQEAYKLAIKAIEEMAQARFRESFVDLTVHRQELILKSLHDGNPDPQKFGVEATPGASLLGNADGRLRDGLLFASLRLG